MAVYLTLRHRWPRNLGELLQLRLNSFNYVFSEQAIFMGRLISRATLTNRWPVGPDSFGKAECLAMKISWLYRSLLLRLRRPSD